MKNIIVSRHPAAVAFIAKHMGATLATEARLPSGEQVEVVSETTAEEVRGKRIWGNVPMALAAAAAEVIAVEFLRTPPRGTEYGVAEMEAAGARLVRYQVATISGLPRL